jgi:hypothetical protein
MMGGKLQHLHSLLTAAFGSENHPLAIWYAGRLTATPVLREFTTAHASKIRKKARLATTAELQRDLLCELAVAAALANDRRSPLSYEPLAAAGRRGPDFLLRHKGHTDVYVEVSRLRPAQSVERAPGERLAGVLCGKFGQLAAGAANLLVLVSDDGIFDEATVASAVQGLRQRADARDDAFFAYRGLAGVRAFHQCLPRLSAILIAAPAAADVLFVPMSARRPLPADLVRSARAWQIGAMLPDCDR